MIKLIIAILLFLLSLLVIFKGPTNLLWQAAVAVTNYPVIFILAAAISILTARSGRFVFVSIACSIIAFVLFCLPVVMGFMQARTLPAAIKNIFPVADALITEKPFNFFKLFTPNKNNSYKTVVYKTIDTLKLTADFYAATQNKKAPLVIVIHGGSWQSGDSKQLPELNTYLSESGYNVASINYRLAPAYKSPAPVEDTRDAIHFLYNMLPNLI